MIPEIHAHLAFLVFGLLKGCPHGLPLDNCPLRPYRSSECLEEKFLLADEWSAGELEAILLGHNHCYWERRRLGCTRR